MTMVIDHAQPLDFATAFSALYDGNVKPYPWQAKLFEGMVENRWPNELDIPTGLGKTSVIAVWLLGHLLGNREAWLPTRLVYVVNRRTIVDQATRIAEELRVRLLSDKVLGKMWSDRFGASLLPVSTLRGALADNREWLENPSCPAVIIGTVDMIGSRLLFNAYRAGKWQRARHAGLIGHDAVIVHDEAHLSSPFQKLVEWVVNTQLDSSRRLRLLSMSATSLGDPVRQALGIGEEDIRLLTVRQRIHAVKSMSLHECQRSLADELVQKALKYELARSRVIVFVTKPEVAFKVYQQLYARFKNDSSRIALLTGTIRGYERDRLVRSPVLESLLTGAKAEKTVYLVSTSAGEVGADFDADHLICDLSDIDSMIQRFGRVNRRGGDGRQANIDVVFEIKESKKCKSGREITPSPVEQAQCACRELLQELEKETAKTIDASPMAIQAWSKRDGYNRARQPRPISVRPHDVVLDAWSLTSIHHEWPLAHDLHCYLHGLDDNCPETYVAWRSEVDLFTSEDSRSNHVINQILCYYPLKPWELLRDRPEAVAELLIAARDRWPNEVIVIVRNRQARPKMLQSFSSDLREIVKEVRYCTVILPVSVNGLSDAGMISPRFEYDHPELDVADIAEPGCQPERKRILLRRDAEGGWSPCGLPSKLPEEVEEIYCNSWTTARDRLQDILRMKYVKQIVMAEDDEGRASARLLLYSKVNDSRQRNHRRVLVSEHNECVQRRVDSFVDALDIDPSERASFSFAAFHHDDGKARECWQRAIRTLN